MKVVGGMEEDKDCGELGFFITIVGRESKKWGILHCEGWDGDYRGEVFVVEVG